MVSGVTASCNNKQVSFFFSPAGQDKIDVLLFLYIPVSF